MKACLVGCLIAAVWVGCVGMALSAAEDEGRIVWASTRAGDGRLNLWAIGPDGTGATRVTRGFVQAMYPSISPDGERIAFSSMDTGVWFIYLIDADGTDLVQLTDFSSAVPHWSPDGVRLVFNSDHDDEPKDTPDLWGMAVDGTGLVEYVDRPPSADFNGRWSPDGKRILFVSNRDGNYNLYALTVDGGGLERLTWHNGSEFNPRWSPDGKRIAFVSDRRGNLDIYVMNVDGTGTARLTDHPGLDRAPAWSPDGTRIVFESDRAGHPDLWIMNADGSDPRALTNDEAIDLQPDWR
jgi:Tol biopolymer transport system component